MGLSYAVIQICVALTTLCSLVRSQGGMGMADPSLLANLLSSQPASTGMGPSVDPMSGAGQDLGALLGTSAPQSGPSLMGPSPGFGAPSMTSSMPPNPSFPSYGGGPSSGFNMPAPMPRRNPMQSIMPLLFMTGRDFNPFMMMMMMLGGGGLGGGGGGGFMSNPFLMMSMMNNM